MESTYCYVTILSIISALWLIGYTQANFNMLTSKKYDHHFFGIYYTAFKKHLKEMNENQFWEAELRKYAKKVDTGGIIKKWTNFWDWKDEKFKYLRQHFFFAVRLINDNSIPAPLLILMHLKYQAFLHAIVYMNGAILLPENDERRIYCRTIATDLLNFSDIGTRSIIKYLEIVLRMFCGQTNKCTDKIKDTLGMWVMAVYSMWNKFGLQMISDSSSKNSSNDMAQLYQKLCDEQNEIMLETKIAMMSLFEGIKQSVDKPYLPPKERLTLHYDAAVSLWDKSKVMWAEHLQISKGKYQIKEMIMQYDVTEMKFYGELKDHNTQEIKFGDLKHIKVFIFHEDSGIIELTKSTKETGVIELGEISEREPEIINLEDIHQDEHSKKWMGSEVIEV